MLVGMKASNMQVGMRVVEYVSRHKGEERVNKSFSKENRVDKGVDGVIILKRT
jgi:hypothetical protein